MKPLNPLIPILLSVVLLSCLSSEKRKNNNKRFSNLRIAIDTNANFYLDSIRLSTQYKSPCSNCREYDSTLNQFVYVFDSVRNGKINLSFISYLNIHVNKSVFIDSDTIIFIPQNELHNFQNEKFGSLPSFKLENGDTIVIGLSILGCFQFVKENIIVSKNQGLYTVGFNTTRGRRHGYDQMNIKRQFDSTFVIQLDNFRQECENLLHRKMICRSTTSASLCIRKGNSVYSLPDIGCGKWEGFTNLIKALDPPWPS